MPKNWRWKAYTVVAAVLLAIYLLVPTFFGLADMRQDLEAKGQPVPWYINAFPKNDLNLGLDLQGGIYIEMEVEIDNAIKRKADVFGSDIERTLKEKQIPFEIISQPKGDGILHIRAKSSSDMDRIKGEILTDFKDAMVVTGQTVENDMPTLLLGFNAQYKNYFETKVVDQALETIRNRIDRYGVSEPTITKAGENRVSIELPGITDPDRAINIIKKTGQLEFHIVDETIPQPKLATMIDKVRADNNLSQGYDIEVVNKINELMVADIPEDSEIAYELEREPTTRTIIRGTPYLIKKKADVTGDMLQNATVSVQDNEPYVNLSFDKRGTELFAEVTTNNVNKRLAIMLDGNVMKAPNIKEPITQGRAQITLGYGDYNQVLKEAEDLTLVLQEGALPATMHEATKTVVGPTLGKDSIHKGITASLIAALAVIVFMLIYYNLSGLWADVALVVNLLLILAILALFNATLTLPGIAGIVLTIGMAVDANVIINERIREELRLGKAPKAAVDAGYKHAMSAVVDSNVTTLISGIILYQFGTGPIKGFAITLSIGILTTLFTAVVITKLIFDYRSIKGKHEHTKLSI